MMLQQRLTVLLIGLFCSAVALAQNVVLPEVTRVELENGTVLLLNEKHDVPLIGLTASIRGGAVADSPELHGTASLLAGLLEKGAGERSAQQFAEAVDSVGATLSASASLESIDVSAGFMARDADLIIELLADMLVRPALDEDEMQKLRERRINFIRSAKDGNLNALMPIYGNAFLFGEHPYGNPVNGSELSLAKITLTDLKAYYEEQLGGNRLIVSVSGDFDIDDMQRKLGDAFADWRAASAPLPVVEAAPKQSGNRVLLIDKPGATQTYFRMSNIGVSREYAKRAELDLVNTLFGGRFTSMLNTALRIESGLTYGAGSSLTRPSQPGSVSIASFTRTEATVEAMDMALGVLGQLRDGTLDDATIQSGKNYVLGQFPTDFETADQLAGVFAMLEKYGLGADYINTYGNKIEAATAESMAAVIDEVYPAADDLVFVILGDAEVIRSGIAKYGPVTELAISEPRFRP